MYMHIFARFCRWRCHTHLMLLLTVLLFTACTSTGTTPTPHTPAVTPTTAAIPTSATNAMDVCPAPLNLTTECKTPHALRVAYSMESLIERGMTGKGQTVVDIVSYGSPTLQPDMDVFDKQFNLPAIKLTILAPLGNPPAGTYNSDMAGWASETTLDVEIIHALAPGANIVVLTSPVDETEGTIGLPEFLQLEQYAVAHRLGQVFSQSYVASETTLADQAGRQLVQAFTTFYQQATTLDGWTIVSGSGDHGATDYSDIAATKISPTPIVNFPADVPWVTAVGGTSLLTSNGASNIEETAWNGSGGGFSTFFSTPSFQKNLPASVQKLLNGRRGLPDIAANADPQTAMAIYYNGHWLPIGGTSAATPIWAGIVAVADQMAGHALGFINPALYTVALSSNASQDYRDITSGNNSFQQSGVNVQGYPAGAGWDPVTGWGAPVGDKLLPDLIQAAAS